LRIIVGRMERDSASGYAYRIMDGAGKQQLNDQEE
jgi:hypothetical protein